jgi:hypothetical protein
MVRVNYIQFVISHHIQCYDISKQFKEHLSILICVCLGKGRKKNDCVVMSFVRTRFYFCWVILNNILHLVINISVLEIAIIYKISDRECADTVEYAMVRACNVVTNQYEDMVNTKNAIVTCTCMSYVV